MLCINGPRLIDVISWSAVLAIVSKLIIHVRDCAEGLAPIDAQMCGLRP